MAKLFLALGTPGAGKTAVLSGLEGVEVFNIGTEMLKVYSKEFGETERDHLKAVEITGYADVVRIRNAVLKKAVRMAGTVVIDTHPSVKSGNAYIPGFSPEDMKTLQGQIKAIIYIDADINDLVERRRNDKTRNREQDSEEMLNQHRTMNVNFVTIYSLYLGAPIYIIKNGSDLEATRKAVSEVIKEF